MLADTSGVGFAGRQHGGGRCYHRRVGGGPGKGSPGCSAAATRSGNSWRSGGWLRHVSSSPERRAQIWSRPAPRWRSGGLVRLADLLEEYPDAEADLRALSVKAAGSACLEATTS